jgi:short-subunit dehydrogenase
MDRALRGPHSRRMHAAITGASSGIGQTLARDLASAGARVTLVARRGELLERLAGDIGAGTDAHGGGDLIDSGPSA